MVQLKRHGIQFCPPTPPRSNRTRRDHTSSAVNSASVVEPPRSKRASKGRSSTEAEPPSVKTPSTELEESKPSIISEPDASMSKRERSKALKTNAKEKNPKGSVRRSLQQKEEKSAKRTIPQPPAPPKRRRRTQSEKPEGVKESAPEQPKAYLAPTPKVKAAAATSTSKESSDSS